MKNTCKGKLGKKQKKQQQQNRKTGRNHTKRKKAKMEEKGRQEGTHLSIAIKQSGMGDRKKGGKKTKPTKQN